MKKLIIAVILILARSHVPLVNGGWWPKVPNHQQWKRVEQWHKNQNDKFKAIEKEVAMSFKNSEFERRAPPAPPSPDSQKVKYE